ncbi:410_t:CDS:2, partial [Scutellospora calospora]
LRAKLKPVSHNMVRAKVAVLAESPQYILQYPGIDKSKWSINNCHRTTVTQKLLEELEVQQQEFLNFVQYRCIQYDYSLSLMSNIDEIPLAFDMPSNVTIDNKGSKTISIRTCSYEKSCFTVVLACIADSKKLPPMIIFKLKNVLCLEFPPENIWKNYTPCSKNPRLLLVMDSFKGHLVSSVKTNLFEKNTNIAIIPGGLISKIQPLDDDLIFDYDRVENNKVDDNEIVDNEIDDNEVDEYIFSNNLPPQQNPPPQQYLSSQQCYLLQDLPLQQNLPQQYLSPQQCYSLQDLLFQLSLPNQHQQDFLSQQNFLSQQSFLSQLYFALQGFLVQQNFLAQNRKFEFYNNQNEYLKYAENTSYSKHKYYQNGCGRIW